MKAEECIYVGDGGSDELETARKLGMKAVQAAWYLQEGTTQPAKRIHDFIQIEKPLDVVNYVEVQWNEFCANNDTVCSGIYLDYDVIL